MAERCPSCDAPLATAADNPDGNHPRATEMCWSLGSGCIREPVDWRARALAAEARLADVAQDLDAADRAASTYQRKLLEVQDAYEDAASVLGQVAAERDRLADHLRIATNGWKFAEEAQHRLEREVRDRSADDEAAASELLVSIDEMPPGSAARRLMIANRLLMAERDRARSACWRWRRAFVEMRRRRDAIDRRLTAAQDDAEECAALLDAIETDVREFLPAYALEPDGDEANQREQVEYAGAEIRRLRAAIRSLASILGTADSTLAVTTAVQALQAELAAWRGPGRVAYDRALDACSARIRELLACNTRHLAAINRLRRADRLAWAERTDAALNPDRPHGDLLAATKGPRP